MNIKKIADDEQVMDFMKSNWYKKAEEKDVIPRYLYHATYANNVESIKQHGLNPNIIGKWNWDLSHPGVIYLSRYPDQAVSYAEEATNVPEEWVDNIIVFKIDTQQIDQEALFPDRNIYDNRTTTPEISKDVLDFEYHGTIPVEALSVVRNGS